MSAPELLVTAPPHLGSRDSTPRIMWTVTATLAPVVVAAGWFFGVGALLELVAAMAGAVLAEQLFGKRQGGGLRDGSALLTGLLLGLSLPAGFPLWMTVLGAGFAIVFGKAVWGGLGYNGFNPALVGRAFLQAAFPVAITTWPRVGGGFWGLRGDLFALPFMHPRPDAITSATPLGLLKFEGRGTPLLDLVRGNTAGSLGETAVLVILIGGGYLALRSYLNWRIPAGILLSVAALSGLLHLLDPRHPSIGFMLASGGLMLGAVYMATDPVTSPITNRGRWVFAIGVGILVVLIRIWGGLPEGVMYAILFMNALVPFINRATQPRVFGTRLRSVP